MAIGDFIPFVLEPQLTTVTDRVTTVENTITTPTTGLQARIEALEANGGNIDLDDVVQFENKGTNTTNKVSFDGFDTGIALRMAMDGDSASLLYAKNSGRWRLGAPTLQAAVLSNEDILCVRDAQTLFPRVNKSSTNQLVTMTVSTLNSAISFNDGSQTHSLNYTTNQNRWSQTFTPTSVATSSQSILTKYDGDNLYFAKPSTSLTASRVVVTNSSGVLASSSVTSAELDRLSGVTSGVQSQLNSLTNSVNDRLALSGGTMTGNLDMNNKDIRACNLVQINDEGLNEGLMFPNWGIVQDGSSLVICAGTWNAVTAYNDTNRVFYFNTDQFSCMNARSGNIRLGSTSARWNGVFSTSNINVSSDEDLKTNIKEIPDSLLDVWFEYVQPCSYELIANKDAVNNKTEVGYIAQDIIAAFEAAGLDWHEWNVVSENSDFGDTSGDNDFYSVNYTAAQLIESMAIRRKLGIKKSKRFTKRSLWNKIWYGWGE